MKGCKNLTSLPDTLAGLISLEILDLSKSSIESLPPSIGQLATLEEILLVKCEKLTRLPDTISGWICLETLDMSRSGVQALPDGIFHLKNAKISFDGCPLLSKGDALVQVLAQPDGPLKRDFLKKMCVGPESIDHLVRADVFPRKRPRDECGASLETMDARKRPRDECYVSLEPMEACEQPRDECCVCLEPMDEEFYRFWECQHTNVCRACVLKLVFPSGERCPFCRAKCYLE